MRKAIFVLALLLGGGGAVPGRMGVSSPLSFIVAVERSTEGKLLWSRAFNEIDLPKRRGDGMEGLAGFEGGEVAGGLAHGLNDERNGAGGGVGVGDGERNALGAFLQQHDDELSGLADLRNARRGHVEPRDIGAELLPVQDGVHGACK